MEYLHSKRTLHLDLKPRNILITHKYQEVKLIDLGFGWSESFLYDLGYTRDYCAPEQMAAKTDQFSPATDIYALGKILQHFHLAEEEVTLRCMKEDPDERFQGIDELRRAIRQSENQGKAQKLLCVLAGIVLIGTALWFRFGHKNDPVLPRIPKGALSGLFTINEAGDQVYFSEGNLQYQASTETWRFAENQWIYTGDENGHISSSYDGWIDLFGWGTSGFHDSTDRNNVNYQPYSEWNYADDLEYNPWGYGPSTNMASIDLTGSSARYDWGVFNPISNGGNQRGLWRTLTTGEWDYILEKRNTSSGIRYAKAKVGTVNGLLLLPDNWNDSLYPLNDANHEKAPFGNNLIDYQSWDALQHSGAVFLPAAGSRWMTTAWGVNVVCAYWTATAAGDTSAYRIFVDKDSIRNSEAFNRADGHAVRLVREKE